MEFRTNREGIRGIDEAAAGSKSVVRVEKRAPEDSSTTSAAAVKIWRFPSRRSESVTVAPVEAFDDAVSKLLCRSCDIVFS